MLIILIIVILSSSLSAENSLDSAEYIFHNLEDSYSIDSTGVVVTIKYCEILNGPNINIIDSINNFIIFSIIEKYPDFESYINKFIEEFKEANSYYPVVFGWERDIVSIINYNSNNILSLSISQYEYSGGAHPNGYLSNYNFNLLDGKKLELEDILIKNYEEELTKIGEEVFRNMYGLEEDEDLMESDFSFLDNKFYLNNNFIISEEGLEFFYNSYEIAPYVFGETEFIISYYSIRNLIDPDGLLSIFIE